MLETIFEWLKDILSSVLPLSPFQQFIDQFRDIPHLEWLNWVVPVQGILIVFGAWLSVLTAFYLYSVLLRWLKVLGD